MLTVKHPIKARIDNQKCFLFMLLDHFPSLLKDWEEEQEKYFRNLAKAIADGDSEIEESEYRQMTQCLDSCEEERSLFYNSMAIAIYSYYESAISKLTGKANTKDLIDAICKSNNICLSSQSQLAIEKLHNDFRLIRNQLCHNNNGTPKNVRKLKQLAEDIHGMDFEDGIMRFSKDDYLKQILQDEYMVLEELTEKLNVKTKFI